MTRDEAFMLCSYGYMVWVTDPPCWDKMESDTLANHYRFAMKLITYPEHFMDTREYVANRFLNIAKGRVKEARQIPSGVRSRLALARGYGFLAYVLRNIDDKGTIT